MIYVIVAVAILTSLFGWVARGKWDEGEIQKKEAEILQREVDVKAAVEEERKRQETWAKRFESRLANLRVEHRTINNEVRRELEKTVYTDCVVPDSGRLLLSRSIDSSNAAIASHVPPKVFSPADVARKGDDGRTPVVHE